MALLFGVHRTIGGGVVNGACVAVVADHLGVIDGDVFGAVGADPAVSSDGAMRAVTPVSLG